MNQTKTKILQISLRADFGGGPEHLYQLSKQLYEKFDIYIACPNDYPYYERYSSLLGKEKIIEIPHRKFSLKYFLRLKKFISSNHLSIIHSHGKGAGIYSRPLALLTNKKCIHTFHGLHIGEYSKMQKILYLGLERLLSKITNKIIAVSNSELKSMLKMRIASKDKICMIQNGVNIPTKKVSAYNNTEKFKIATISRFDYAKNSELIIDIIAKLAKIDLLEGFEFNIIGDGEDRILIQKKIDELNFTKYVKFHGMLSNPQEILLNMDCYLTTSRWEGLPLAVIEAMSLGLPVIGTNVTGHKDVIIDHTNGYFYDITEPNYAAELLSKLSKDNGLVHSLSENARKLVQKNFDVCRMAQETASVYNQILSHN